MFNIDDILRVATAAVGALVLATLSVGAAVGPARVIETTPLVSAQVQTVDQAHA